MRVKSPTEKCLVNSSNNYIINIKQIKYNINITHVPPVDSVLVLYRTIFSAHQSNGVKSAGKLTAVCMELFIDSCWEKYPVNISALIPLRAVSFIGRHRQHPALQQCFWVKEGPPRILRNIFILICFGRIDTDYDK